MSGRKCVSACAALLLGSTLLPRVSMANDSKSVTATMEIFSPTSLGGTQLKSGTYKVIADGSMVTLKRGNKPVAEAPVKWKSGNAKPDYSSIVTDAKGIEEIHFEGKTDYLEVEE